MTVYKPNNTPMIGLTSEEATRSRRENGANSLEKQKKQSFAMRFFANFGDPIIKILLCALAVNLLFMFRNMNILETIGIITAIFLAAFISTISEYGSEKAFEKIKNEAEQTFCRVMRDGVLCSLAVTDIVCGDILHLGAGEKAPADCIIINGEISTDQSALNGESREVLKRALLSNSNNELSLDSMDALLCGCIITSGECTARVMRVGNATEYGRLANEIQDDTRQSPLKLRLAHLAKLISRVGYAAAVLVTTAYLFDIFIIDSNFNLSIASAKLANLPFLFDNLIHALTLGITVIVVAVPEGLPMMITVVLSSNMKRMMRDNVLVRKLVGIETAGSLNILFCDKTGTITKGKMQTAAYIPLDGRNSEYTPEHISTHGEIGRLLALSARLNTSCEETGGGNTTDRALFSDFLNADISGWNVLSRVHFDSRYKYSATHISGSSNFTLIKGAPELLLASAAYCIRENGERIKLDNRLRETAMKLLHTHTARASRVIAIAVTDGIVTPDTTLPPLTMVAFVVLRDEVRCEVYHALRDMQSAGVQVVMITGDNRETATAVAMESGLISSPNALTVTGEELATIDDKALVEILPRLRVIARALPSDKTRLVRIAQSLGLVTGMTGDGVNDAPALKKADVGFAMGSGTEVAKEASDIVILDNNFASITRAVLFGRTIFKSIRKFIVFQLTMNMCAVGISLIGPFIGIDTPITVIQMLWINIIMDTLGGLAFAGEAPKHEYMMEKPKRRDERILTNSMTKQIIHDSFFTVVLCIFYLVSPSTRTYFEYENDIVRFMTGFYALFIFASVLNCFNTRTHRLNLLSGLAENKLFIAIIIFIMCVELLMLFFGGSVFRTDGLTPQELLAVCALSASVIPIDLIRKVFMRLNGNSGKY